MQASVAKAYRALFALLGDAADAAQPLQPAWFFWAYQRRGASVGGERPDCIQLSRSMQSRTNTSHNPGSKTIREFRRPVFFINEWLQLVYFSSFKTGPRRPELKANRMLRLYPEELEEGASEEDVSSLSAFSKNPAESCPALTTALPSRSSGFYTDLSDEDLSVAQIHRA